MRKFLQSYTPRKLFRDLVVTLLFAAATRLWFWLLQVPLDMYREIAFWCLAPVSGLMLVALATYARGQLLEKPNIMGRIDNITIGPFVGEPNLIRCQIVIIATLRNTGTPTSVDDWELLVRVAGATEAKRAVLIVPRDIEIIGHRGSGMLSSEETLYDMAMEPLEKGRMLRGHLLFEYEQRADIVGRPGTVVTLSWEDVTGSRNSVEHILGDSGSRTLADGSYPGLTSRRFKKHDEE